MLITLDPSLKLNPKYLKYTPKFEFIDGMTDKQTNWQDKTETQSLFYQEDNLPEQDVVLHSNYLEYLEKCWASHATVVISPDIIWNMLLCELALIIAEKPETYRSLFTDAPEGATKKEISVYSDSLTLLPLDAIMAELKKLVPDQFTNAFLLNFSTTTDRSRWAQYATFAQAVSPYFSYSMFMCGLSAVRLDGTAEDWTNLINSYFTIVNSLSKLDLSNEAYFYGVHKILTRILDVTSNHTDIAEDPKAYFKGMFRLEKCGSGSETEVFGWITDLYRKQPDGVRKVQNFSTHVSKVEYKQLNTGKRYVMKSGLFSSKLVDGVLEPDFSYVVYEKTEPVTSPIEDKPVQAKIHIAEGGKGLGGIVKPNSFPETTPDEYEAYTIPHGVLPTTYIQAGFSLVEHIYGLDI